MTDHQMKVDVSPKDTPADPLNDYQVPLIVDNLLKIDAHATHSTGNELNSAIPKDCTPLARLPNEDIPGTASFMKMDHGLE
jgi:hypothetical protein